MVANTTITAATNDTLNLTVDGVSATVTLAAGTYTAATLAAEVQSKINGASAFSSAGTSVAVTQSAGVLTMTSNRYGAASTVNVTGGNGLAGLMGTPTNTAGIDVAGTINGAAGTGSGQYLTGAAGTSVEGLKLQITGGATGGRGTINYSQGYAYKLDKLAESLLGTSGPVASRTKSIDSSIKDVTNRREVLNRRLVDTEKRYRTQFVALDVLVSRLRTTSDFLAQQLANLPKP